MVQQKGPRRGLALQRHPRAHPSPRVYTVSDPNHVMSPWASNHNFQEIHSFFIHEFRKVSSTRMNNQLHWNISLFLLLFFLSLFFFLTRCTNSAPALFSRLKLFNNVSTMWFKNILFHRDAAELIFIIYACCGTWIHRIYFEALVRMKS